MLASHAVKSQDIVFKGNINKTEKDTRFIYAIEHRGVILMNLNRGQGIDNFYLIDSTSNVIQVYDIGPNSNQRYQVFHMDAKGEFFYVYAFYTITKTPPNSERITLTNLQYLKFARDGSLRPQFTNLTGTNPYDQYLVTHTRNDTTYIVGADKNKLTVSVSLITPSQQIIRKEYQLPDRKTFRQFFREDYFPVKDLSENSFETFLHPNKFYVQDKQLIFISDDDGAPVTNIPGNPTASLNRNVTFVTTLNLATGKATVQELRHHFTVKTDHNSFLHENMLFSLRFTNDEYSISVFDISSLKEVRKYSQFDIEKSLDWSKFIITENTTLSTQELKSEFQKRTRNSTPVIGIHHENGEQIFFGLMQAGEGGGQKLGDVKITSLGYLLMYYASTGHQTEFGGTLYNSTSDKVLMRLPLYYVPPEIRTDGRRIYTKIPIDLSTLSLSTSIRPTSIYDEFEQIRVKDTKKKHDNAVFSFENTEAVFLAYFTKPEGSEDVFVVIEKYPRNQNPK